MQIQQCGGGSYIPERLFLSEHQWLDDSPPCSAGAGSLGPEDYPQWMNFGTGVALLQNVTTVKVMNLEKVDPVKKTKDKKRPPSASAQHVWSSNFKCFMVHTAGFFLC